MNVVNVLFVDDDFSIQTLATAMLSNSRFRVFGALNTRQAEKILQSDRIDVIILDVMLPDEDGIQFCRRLKESGNSIPVMMLSALSQPEAVAKGLQAGAAAYLVKPFDPRELEKRVLALVRRSPLSSSKVRHSPEPSGISKFLRKYF